MEEINDSLPHFLILRLSFEAVESSSGDTTSLAKQDVSPDREKFGDVVDSDWRSLMELFEGVKPQEVENLERVLGDNFIEKPDDWDEIVSDISFDVSDLDGFTSLKSITESLLRRVANRTRKDPN